MEKDLIFERHQKEVPSAHVGGLRLQLIGLVLACTRLIVIGYKKWGHI